MFPSGLDFFRGREQQRREEEREKRGVSLTPQDDPEFASFVNQARRQEGRDTVAPEFKVGDRLYLDPETFQATPRKTDIPLYFDAQRRELTPEKTSIPAIHGMVASVGDLPEDLVESLRGLSPSRAGILAEQTRDQRELRASAQMRERFQTAESYLQEHGEDPTLAARQRVANELRTIDRQIVELLNTSGGRLSPNQRTRLQTLMDRRQEHGASPLLEQPAPDEPDTVQIRTDVMAPEGMSINLQEDVPFFSFARSSDVTRAFDKFMRASRNLFGISVGNTFPKAHAAAALAVDTAKRALGTPLRYLGAGIQYIRGREPQVEISTFDRPEVLEQLGATEEEVELRREVVSDLENMLASGVDPWTFMKADFANTALKMRRAWISFRTQFQEERIDGAPRGRDPAEQRLVAFVLSNPEQVSDEDIRRVLSEETATQLINWKEERQQKLDRLGELESDISNLRSTAQLLRAEIPDETLRELNTQLLEMSQEAWALQKETDIRAETHAYRWSFDLSSQGPVFEEEMDQAMAQAIAQQGRLLQPWEMEEISHRFTDPMAEFTGEVIFDPLNLIPGELFAKIAFAPLKLIWQGAEIPQSLKGLTQAEKVLGVADLFDRHAPEFTKTITRQFNSLAVISAGNEYGAVTHGTARRLSQAVGNDYDEFKGAYEVLVQAAKGQQVTRNVATQYNIGQYLIKRTAELFQYFPKFADEGTAARFIDEVSEVVRRDELVRILDETPDIAQEAAEAQARDYARNPQNLVKPLQSAMEEAIIESRRLRGMGIGQSILDEGLIAEYVKWAKGADVDFGKGFIIPTYLRFQQAFRSWWIPLTLTFRPSYTIRNYIDNAWRAGLNGGDLVTDLRTIIDDIGPENIPSEVRGGFFHQLGTQASDDVAERIIDGWDPRGGALGIFLDGLRKEDNIFLKIGSGLEQANRGHEFLFRLRLYYGHYKRNWTLARRLIRGEVSRVLSEVGAGDDAQVARYLEEMVRRGNDNPAELRRLAEGDIRFIIPDELHQRLSAQVGENQARLILRSLAEPIQGLLDEGAYSLDEARRVLETVRLEIDDKMAEAMADASELRRAGETINQDLGDLDPRQALQEEVVEQDIDSINARRQNVEPMSEDAAERRLQAAAGDVDRRTERIRELVSRGDMSDEERVLVQEILDEVPALTVSQALDDARRVLRSEAIEVDEAIRGSGIVEEAFSSQRAVLEEMRDQMATPEYARLVSRLREAERTEGRKLAQAVFDFSERRRQINQEARTLIEAGEDAEIVNVLQQVEGLMAETENALSYTLRGPGHRFALHVWPGPVGTTLTTNYRAIAFNNYSAIQLNMYKATRTHLEEIAHLVDIENYDALVQMYQSGALPTAEEFFERAGWLIRWENDEIVRFRPLQNMSTISNPRDERIAKFKDYFGFEVEEDFLRPMTRPLADDVPIQEVPDAAAAEDLGEQIVRDTFRVDAEDEIWRAIISAEDITGDPLRGSGFDALQLEDGTPVLDSYDTFETFVENESRRLRALDTASGHRQADYLEDMLLRVRTRRDGMRAMQGLIDKQIPQVPNIYNMPAGAESALRSADSAYKQYQTLQAAVDDFEVWLTRMDESGTPLLQNFTPEQRRMIENAGLEVSEMFLKAEDAINYGGDFLGEGFRGAVDVTNKAMINYGKFSQVDRFIKQNTHPFWMFPSRSIPQWIEFFVHNPWLPAFHMKYIRFSHRIAFAEGATTSRGDPLPSMAGYLPLPGTDLWFNPVAPLSSSWVIPRIYGNYFEEYENRPITQQFVSWLHEYGTAFGFYPYPHLTRGLYGLGLLDENETPKWAIVPTFDLIPWFAVQSVEEKVRSMKFGDAVMDLVNPHASWEDFFIEQRVLLTALDKVSDPTIPDDRKHQIAYDHRAALSRSQREVETERGRMLREIYNQAKYEVGRNNYVQGLTSFFTGFWPKPFTDTEADLISVRKENNRIKWALNDELGATIFELPVDINERYDHYKNIRYETPTGLIANAYDTISWVTNDEGQAITDPEEREKEVAQSIYEDQQTEAWLTARAKARDWFQGQLNSLPVGIDRDSEAYQSIINKYTDWVANIERLYPGAQTDWMIGYKPEKIVYEQFRDAFWSIIRNTRPKYEDGIDFDEYEQSVEEWKNEINAFGSMILNRFGSRLFEFEFFDPSLNYPNDLTERLMEEATREGYEQWEVEQMTARDAANEWWFDNFYGPIMDIRTSGGPNEQKRLQELKFIRQNFPEGKPSADQIRQGIIETYGDIFTEEELNEALAEGRVYDVDDRRLDVGGESARVENEMWDLLFRVGPSQQYGQFRETLEEIGGDDAIESLNTWYVTGGNSEAWTDPEEFEAFQETVKKAIAQMNLPEPSAGQIQERLDARRANDQFRGQVTSTLGEDFYDLLGRYSSMDDVEKADFRRENPEEYAKIPAYFDMKDQYAIDNPTWAKWYHREIFAALQEGQTIEQAIQNMQRGARSGAAGRGRGGGSRRVSRADIPGGFLSPGMRSTLQAGELLDPSQLGRGGVTRRPFWPDWLLESLGEVATEELNNMVANEEPLSPQTESFLKNMASRREGEQEETLKEIIRTSEHLRRKLREGRPMR